jgi:NCS1 family nucleobase:cation symporter-1
VLVIAHYGIPHPNTADLHGGFNEGLFLGSIALCFIYAAGYAPYVADYSRYLPANSSAKATGWWTYFGLAISSIWLFLVGAYLTMVTGFNFNTLGSVFAVTDHFSRAFTYIAAVVMICTMVLQGSLSMYAGGNTTVSIVTSLQRRPRPVKPNLSMRLASLTPISILCLIAAILYAKSFATAFTDMLGVLLILLIPWSTINLVDYYFVRRGHYNIADIFNPHGRYGTFNPAGLVSFFLAFGLEWLFVNLSFYQSPVAHALHDGDISWVVGMLVSGGCYLWMTKSVREAARAHEKGRVPEDMAAEVAES